MLDCGLVKVQTSLDILDKYYEMIANSKLDNIFLNDRHKIPPVIEIQNVSLSNMEISKYYLNYLKDNHFKKNLKTSFKNIESHCSKS